MLNNKHQRLHHLLSLHLPYHCNVDGFRQSFVCILISMTWDVCLWLVGPTVLDGLCSAGVSFAGQNTEDRPLILRLAGPGDRRHGNRSCPNTTTTHVEPCLHLIQRVACWNRPERTIDCFCQTRPRPPRPITAWCCQHLWTQPGTRSYSKLVEVITVAIFILI